MDIKDYVYKTKPYGHQVIGFEMQARKKYFANLADLGTGKTKISLDVAAFMYYNGHINALLVFGNNGSYTNWVPGIEEHLPDDIPRTIGVWSSKNGKKKTEEMLKAIYAKTGLRIFLMNIEALSWPKGPVEALKFVQAHKTLVIVDESTTIANPSSSRTKMAWKIGKFAIARRILTGSVVDNNPLDAWAQYQFLSNGALGFTSYVAFRAHYAELKDMRKQDGVSKVQLVDDFGNKVFEDKIIEVHGVETVVKEPVMIEEPTYRTFKVVTGTRNLDELKEKMNSISFIVKKEDCLDLPGQVWLDYWVDLTKEQQTMYEQMRKRSIAEIEEQMDYNPTVSAKIGIVKLLRLHQIVCGHVKDDEGIIHSIPSKRIEALHEQLKETRGKVIIWTTFTHDVVKIKEFLEKEYGRDSFLTYYGASSIDERELAKKVFKRGGEVDHINFLVANDKTGGFGNNWTAATNTFYYSYRFDNNIFHQTIDRNYRIGQTEKVTYTMFKARGTVDEKICSVLKNKQNIADFLTPSNWKDTFEGLKL